MKRLPLYIKVTAILLSTIMIVFILIIGRPILSPLVLAVILSMLLHPFCKKLEHLRVPPVLSALISILIIFSCFFTVFSFISYEVSAIAKNLPETGSRVDFAVDKVTLWLEDSFGIREQEQSRYLKTTMNNLLQGSANLLGVTVGMTADIVSATILIFFSIFFFLYYRQFFVEFLYKLTEHENNAHIRRLLYRIEEVVKSYVLGISLVIVILAILNTLGLYLIGIEYAFFFGVLAAALTIIPYLGVFIGSLLPITYSLLTKDALWYPIAIAVLFSFIQFMEGNFITPNIVGNKVSLNPYVVLLALFVGGFVWGPVGMILAIPIVAVAKVICDENETLRPFGYLLGHPPKRSDISATMKKNHHPVTKKAPPTEVRI